VFNSAQLLMLSGVGPSQHLEELGIPVIKDLKVGYNLQDHVSMAALAFLINDSVSLIEGRLLSNLSYGLDLWTSCKFVTLFDFIQTII